MSLLERVKKELKSQNITKSRVVGLSVSTDPLNFMASIALIELGYRQILLPNFLSKEQKYKLINKFSIVDFIDDSTFSSQTTNSAKTTTAITGRAVNSNLFRSIRRRLLMNKAGRIILQTSGTTAKPKLIEFSLDDLTYQSMRHPEYKNARYLRLNSTHHNNALRRRLYCYLQGGVNIFANTKTISDLTSASKEYRITHIDMSRYHLSQLLEIQPDLPSNICIVSAGSPLPDSDSVRKLANSYNLYARYAAIEVGTIAMCGPIQSSDTVYLYKLKSDVLTSVEKNTEHDIGGLLYVKALGIGKELKGEYEKNQDQNRYTSDWYCTGDLVAFKKCGDFQVLGRECNMINFNGKNINPLEIELILNKHPKVINSAAFSIDSDIHGQIPAAVAQCASSCSISEFDLLKYSRDQLGFSRPRKIIITTDNLFDELTGKLNRVKISRKYID